MWTLADHLQDLEVSLISRSLAPRTVSSSGEGSTHGLLASAAAHDTAPSLAGGTTRTLSFALLGAWLTAFARFGLRAASAYKVFRPTLPAGLLPTHRHAPGAAASGGVGGLSLSGVEVGVGGLGAPLGTPARPTGGAGSGGGVLGGAGRARGSSEGLGLLGPGAARSDGLPR